MTFDPGAIDLTRLTVSQVVTMAAVLAAIDTVAAIVLALGRGTFSLAYVGVWLTSHVAMRVFPIYALVILGAGLPGLTPGVPALFALAVAGLAAYLGETVKSILINFHTSAPPTDETPVGG